VELVRRNLASSREDARRLIEARSVTVNGAPAERAARSVLPGDAVEVLRVARFVSRGGEKLDGALNVLGIDVEGRRCVDVGASTGGFTDCLLQRGAAEVVAVDVGRAQLHERLRASPRVVSLEGVNVRHLETTGTGGPAEIVTADLSFISLRLVMERLGAFAAADGDVLLLVKPQFEAGRREASRGRGVIRSVEVWRRVLNEVAESAAGEGLQPLGVVLAEPPGAEGNAEFFLHCRRRGAASPRPAGAAAGAAGASAADVAFAAAVELAVEAAARRAAVT
jgi:23S rRNA (cytidine1920-2'-O)/16S rRNA (cytidine1409-2'-O)-methyltransferase